MQSNISEKNKNMHANIFYKQFNFMKITLINRSLVIFIVHTHWTVIKYNFDSSISFKKVVNTNPNQIMVHVIVEKNILIQSPNEDMPPKKDLDKCKTKKSVTTPNIN